MEIKKGLSFAKATENIKARLVAFFSIIGVGTAIIITLILLLDSKFLSEKIAITAAQGIFLGVLVAL